MVEPSCFLYYEEQPSPPRDKAESSPDDFWDKYDLLWNALANLFSVAGLSFLGSYATFVVGAATGLGTFFAFTFAGIGKFVLLDIVSEIDGGKTINEVLALFEIDKKYIHEVKFLASCAFLILSASFVFFFPPAVSAYFYERAEIKYDRGDFPGAIEALQLAKALHKDDSACLLLLSAVVKEDYQRFSAAMREYELAMEHEGEICALKAAINYLRLKNIINQANSESDRPNKLEEDKAIALGEKTFLKFLSARDDVEKEEYRSILGRLLKNLSWAIAIKKPDREFKRLLEESRLLGEETASCLAVYYIESKDRSKDAKECLSAISGFYGFVEIRWWRDAAEIFFVDSPLGSSSYFDKLFVDRCNHDKRKQCYSQQRDRRQLNP